MSYQLALITRVVHTGDIRTPIEYGITLDDFTNEEAQRAWGVIFQYHMAHPTRGSTLNQEAMRQWGYAEQWYDYPNETIESLCYNVRVERLRANGNTIIAQIAAKLADPGIDPVAAMSAMRSMVDPLISLGTQKNTDTNLRHGLQNILQKQELAAQGVNLSKMPWPWEPLNKATMGVQPDDYIVFYGRPKSMKTWVLCYLLAWAFMNEKRVVLYTKEMTQENVWMRAVACIERLPYNELRESTAPQAAGGRPMTHEGMTKLRELLRQLEEYPDLQDLLTIIDGREAAGHDTVHWLESKAKNYRADILFVDGLYLLSDAKNARKDDQRVMNISRALRASVLNTGIPCIATMQANRKASGHKDANLDEIAYSDALSQDCTIAARVIAEKGKPFIDIVMGGSREFSLQGFRIHGVPATNFTYAGDLTAKDVQKAKEKDDESGEPDPNKKKAKKAANKAMEEAQANDIERATNVI